ncbi:MAG: hypothetical protein JWQ89_3945 [Devosia sp.]|uniref:heme-degrading domain-containing protein n=1 Tax=Devosia sp. TaxID=1871048 RepID=UPI00262379B0|nr:heme-degrading domain-containing protein [Devosia sp.]MDB5542218.1 hypothetical protein [Devosia sp.]
MSVESDIELVEQQEKQLVFQRFDEATALKLGEDIRKLAEAAGSALTIDVRFWNRPLYYYAMPGTGPDNPEWVRRKSNCVRRFNRASYAMTLRQKRQGRGFAPDENVDPAEIAAHGGSFPIRIEGVSVVGAITVSGVPGRLDHGFVVEAVANHLGIDPAALRLPPEAPAA